ncbi:MAG: amidase, partial [Actinomycetia bacterium]|nr:amidase [Actinomycetes bacterium]
MITPAEYGRYDATGLARLVADEEVSPSELAEAAISLVEDLNPALNAVIATDFDRARHDATAGLPAGPLHGVPWLVKDLGTNVAGLAATNGS